MLTWRSGPGVFDIPNWEQVGVNRKSGIGSFGKKKWIYNTKPYNEFKSAVRAYALAARGKTLPFGIIKKDPVSVTMHFAFRSARSDIDGPEKAILDALQGICYANDRQIDEKHTFKSVCRERPSTIVSVRLIGQ